MGTWGELGVHKKMRVTRWYLGDAVGVHALKRDVGIWRDEFECGDEFWGRVWGSVCVWVVWV